MSSSDFICEPFRQGDARDACELMAKVPEIPSPTTEAFARFAALGFNQGARDFRVVRRRGRMIALLTSTRLPDTSPPVQHFRIVVAPEWQRQGIGSMLLRVVDDQAGRSRGFLQCNTNQSWSAATRFLESAGFHVQATNYLMSRPSGADRAAAVPKDFQLRAAQIDDHDAWRALHADGYSDRDDFCELTAEDVEAERTRPGFVLLVAEQAGEVVGFCHGLELSPDVGLVNSLVVHSKRRKRGLGRALLSACVRSMSTSLATIELNVAADNASAIAVYRRLGFTTYDTMIGWRRDTARACVKRHSGGATCAE